MKHNECRNVQTVTFRAGEVKNVVLDLILVWDGWILRPHGSQPRGGVR